MNPKPQQKPADRNWYNTLGLISGFGLSFAAEVYFVGVVFGGWLDRTLTGGSGLVRMLMVLFAIVVAFVTFFRLLTQLEKRRTPPADETPDGASAAEDGRDSAD